MADLVAAGTGHVCLVAKSAPWHVTETLRTTTTEALDMVADSVSFLRNNGKVVFVDAEHFFDGYLEDPRFFRRLPPGRGERGRGAGAVRHQRRGTLPHQVERTVGEAREIVVGPPGRPFPQRLGLRGGQFGRGRPARAPTTCRAASTATASARATPTSRRSSPTSPSSWASRRSGRAYLALLTPVARHIAEIVNIAPAPHQPFVGLSAFAHKAGIHTSAIARAPSAYSHIDPEAVGNDTRFVLSGNVGAVHGRPEGGGDGARAETRRRWPTWSNS